MNVRTYIPLLIEQFDAVALTVINRARVDSHAELAFSAAVAGPLVVDLLTDLCIEHRRAFGTAAEHLVAAHRHGHLLGLKRRRRHSEEPHSSAC